ncbi:uncharacterized protein ASPGLDRAFT_1165936 [Aspergillus glaucus CBS 516.65]|uniref:Uncharacterized protein n=1 Tax=Aspergillus glaucus CBS 516.65 TaxID=1160497 RepID=A0A1L9VTZ1_ASPGL|nr:hypothetical protein ASPGLDRAFT_1165936 [Aspergillus glaucus CBS 516.65]OJJ87360.1 hypothetical protein ASPGLDRAFT_1165936 [Aspergillus glaucus CBS 516.65]
MASRITTLHDLVLNKRKLLYNKQTNTEMAIPQPKLKPKPKLKWYTSRQTTSQPPATASSPKRPGTKDTSSDSNNTESKPPTTSKLPNYFIKSAAPTNTLAPSTSLYPEPSQPIPSPSVTS